MPKCQAEGDAVLVHSGQVTHKTSCPAFDQNADIGNPEFDEEVIKAGVEPQVLDSLKATIPETLQPVQLGTVHGFNLHTIHQNGGDTGHNYPACG